MQPNPHIQVHDSAPFPTAIAPWASAGGSAYRGRPPATWGSTDEHERGPSQLSEPEKPAARQPLLTKLSEPKPRGTRGPPAAPSGPQVRSCPALVTGAGRRRPRGHLVSNRWGRKAPGDTPLTRWPVRPLSRRGSAWGRSDMDKPRGSWASEPLRLASAGANEAGMIPAHASHPTPSGGYTPAPPAPHAPPRSAACSPCAAPSLTGPEVQLTEQGGPAGSAQRSPGPSLVCSPESEEPPPKPTGQVLPVDTPRGPRPSSRPVAALAGALGGQAPGHAGHSASPQ